MTAEQRTLIFKIAKELSIDEEQVLLIHRAIGLTIKTEFNKIKYNKNKSIDTDYLPVVLIPNFGKFTPAELKIKAYNNKINSKENENNV